MGKLQDCLLRLKNDGVYLEPILGVKEWAWKYEAAKELLECLNDNSYIVLGGDVLKQSGRKLDYAMSNWYY